MEKYGTLKKYMDRTWHNIQYPYLREQMQARIIRSHFMSKPQVLKPQIIYTGGCYGAGKGHTLRYMESIGKINLSDYVHVDPDKIRAQFPEYLTLIINQPEKVGEVTGKEAGYIVELIEYYALENNYNIIIDGSLHNYEWYLDHFNMINKTFQHYEIVIIFVFARLEDIFQRNVKRHAETKRWVPESSIIKTFNKIDVAYEEYSKVIKKCFRVRNFDNDNQSFCEDVSNINI